MLLTDMSRTNTRDGFRDECGVFGIFGSPEAANLTYLGLYALQHRGQDAAGITTYKNHMHKTKGMGLVRDIFSEKKIKHLKGNQALESRF